MRKLTYADTLKAISSEVRAKAREEQERKDLERLPLLKEEAMQAAQRGEECIQYTTPFFNEQVFSALRTLGFRVRIKQTSLSDFRVILSWG